MKKLSFALVAVIIICACATAPQQYRLANNYYEDLRYGFSLDLPNKKFWKIHIKWPEEFGFFPKELKNYKYTFRLSMINESQIGVINVIAWSTGDLIYEAKDLCDEYKEEFLKSYESNLSEEKPWNVDDFLKGNDCLLKAGAYSGDFGHLNRGKPATCSD